MPGAEDTLLDEPATGAHPDLVAEAAGEGALAHPRPDGQLVDGDRVRQVLQRPLPGGGGPGRRLARDGLLDVLRLATVAPWRGDAAARDRVRDSAAVIATHQVQAQIDPGCRAR